MMKNALNVGIARNQIAMHNEVTNVTKITLPIAPISINTLYSFYKGRKLLTKSGRRWREKVDPILAMVGVNYTEPVGVRLEVWPKAARPFDLDNVAKSILDALERASILENDDLVYYLALEKHNKHPDKVGGSIWIDIWPYPPRP